MNKNIARLQFITMDLPDISHVRQVELACEGGIRWVQLRMKNSQKEVIRKTAIQALEVCRSYNAILIINDFYDVALDIVADGVHLGKNDANPEEVRKIAGEKFIIGGTADCVERMLMLSNQVDYIGFGPYRFTYTKKQLSPVLGVEGIKKGIEIMQEKQIDIPVIAIGGIKLNDINLLYKTGVYGVAISSAIALAPDIKIATQTFINSINAWI